MTTCNKVDGIFSWQRQASLGGYIGADLLCASSTHDFLLDSD